MPETLIILIIIDEELKSVMIKIILPAIIGFGIRIVMQFKTEKVSWITIVTSFVSGVGCAYLSSGVVLSNFSEEWVPIVIGIIAISGEKIGAYATNKINVEVITEFFIEAFVNKFSNKNKTKNE